MQATSLSELMKKAEELKVVPFLEDLVDIIKEIKPILNGINKSIEENVQKVPGATEKLSKVSEATEFATTEIMNTLDGVFGKTDNILKEVHSLRDSENMKSGIAEMLTKLKANESTKGFEQDLEFAIEYLRSSKENENTENDHVANIENSINEIITESNNIMMSLQVQDITSQQIAAVNHLLKTMQIKLAKILMNFKTSEIAELMSLAAGFDENQNISKLHREIAFDPEAINAISGEKKRQQDVDDLVERSKRGDLSDNEEVHNQSSPSAQSDIDKMIAEASKEEEANPSSDEVSQDDIDALFGNSSVDLSDSASQDDIDNLFNNAND